jgi:transcriptional regulator with XRE-family HTH domain
MPVFKGALLRAKRESVGITRERLAAVTGRSYGLVVKLETDQVRPSVTTLGLLSMALSCPVDEFFGDGEVDTRDSDLGPDVDRWIAKTLATAPAMSPEIARRVSAALFGGAS